ncbi:hypothetical protein V9N52_003531 [Vibrio navarrensis]
MRCFAFCNKPTDVYGAEHKEERNKTGFTLFFFRIFPYTVAIPPCCTGSLTAGLTTPCATPNPVSHALRWWIGPISFAFADIREFHDYALTL